LLDVEKIRQLIEMMVNNDLVEVSLRDGDVEVNLRRPHLNGAVTVSTIAGGPIMPAAPVAAVSSSAAMAPEAPARDTAESSFVEITSPMVGTFYSGPDPESPPFVSIGGDVEPGTVVCILEAMKVFNEIKSEVAGRIERILVKNSEPVEYGQPLFLVRPL